MTSVVMLLMGCAALVALLGADSAHARATLEAYPDNREVSAFDNEHDVRKERAAKLPLPAQRDEAVWKRTVLDMFGNWQSATSSNLNLEQPSEDAAYRGGGGARIGPYRPPAADEPEGKLLSSAAKTEAQWSAQVAAMEDGQLSENREILNNVGADHWKAHPVAMPHYRPTVILKIPKVFKNPKETQEQAADPMQDLPEITTYEKENAAALEKNDEQNSAFLGLQKGLEAPDLRAKTGPYQEMRAQRPQQLLQTQASVQGLQLAVKPTLQKV